MEKLKDDERCIEIETMLDHYAAAAKEWQIYKRCCSQKGNMNRFDFSAQNPYPYDDSTEARMLNRIDTYLLSLDPEEQKLANGRLLWHYKKYFSQPFAKHAIILASHAISAYALKDDDKIQFLEYLFRSAKDNSNGLLNRFNRHIFYKLADYNPNGNLEATNRLYNKALGYFTESGRKNDGEMALIYGMFEVFAHNAKELSPDAVVNYAELYFKMTEKTSKPLDASVLGILAIKTTESRKVSEALGDRSILDKEALKGIFAAYAKYVNEGKDFNPQLADQMKILAKRAFSAYEYTLKETEGIVSAIRPLQFDEKGNKIRNNKRRDGLTQMADELEVFAKSSLVRQRHPLRDIEFDNPQPMPNNDQIVYYAHYLFEDAISCPDKDIRLEGLYKLLTQKGEVDKSLILDVVDVYGASVNRRQLNEERNNIGLHRKMTKMLQHIVTEYDYTIDEVNNLCHHVVQGGNGHQEFAEMGRVIEANYVATDDWHYSIVPQNKINPIVHKTIEK